MDISDDIEDEKDRVAFIRQVCQLFASKARITLNPTKMYEAMQSSDAMIEHEDDMGSNTMMDLNLSS